jgi:hypothetical protein
MKIESCQKMQLNRLLIIKQSNLNLKKRLYLKEGLFHFINGINKSSKIGNFISSKC